MKSSSIKPESDLYHKLKWLMFFRVLFSSLLLGSTIILQLSESTSPLAKPLLVLYGLIGGIFLLSFVYALILQSGKQEHLFAYVQTGIDTFVVTLIIFVTGSYSSIFSFLYLVVIIYSSMLLFKRGSIIMAVLCSIQYGIMVDLEYYGFLKPLVMEGNLAVVNYPWSHVLYKIMITMVACFAVAFLSGTLSEQAKKTRKDLTALEDHVKRVEKMAYMGEMAAGMAHEIKNPLASLSGSIQLLREDLQYDPDRDKLMQIVLRETDRLSALVNNFLLFAKPPAANVEEIRLDKALKDAVELFRNDITCKGRVVIQNNFVSGIWIEMDSVHFRQVLWNLLLNAAEAIAGTGVIEISMYPIKNKQVCIEIADNGCGMSRELIQSIFDPFFTTKQKGTGLGLSIVHSILEPYGNRLDIESKVGEGTTFFLRLKRIDPPA
ncbi:nitrogen regulation protein NR(II) [Thermodesulfobacteriota bacterium]